MIRIAPYPLWIGHRDDRHDLARLAELGIEAVVELAAEEEPSPAPRGLIACRFPLIDGTGNRPELLVLVARTIAALVGAEIATLVCCGSGVSRAPALAAVGLAVAHREPPDATLKWVASHHACDVSPGLWHDLIAIFPRAAEPPARL